MNIVLDEGVKLPEYKTMGSAGFDLTAFKVLNVFKGSESVSSEKLKRIQEGFNERGYLKIRGFERVLFGTGIKVAIPEGFEMQIRSRSGITLNKGLMVLNSPGTIDSDYRGEIGVIMYNSTQYLATIPKNERICQGVLNKLADIPLFNIVDSLEETERGSGGFGSTGTSDSI